jgi:hypothetical protein
MERPEWERPTGRPENILDVSIYTFMRSNVKIVFFLSVKGCGTINAGPLESAAAMFGRTPRTSLKSPPGRMKLQEF